MKVQDNGGISGKDVMVHVYNGGSACREKEVIEPDRKPESDSGVRLWLV